MVSKFEPELNKVYFINHYTMYHILEGRGGIEVDFKNYFEWADKLIFLEKGQYVKFLNHGFLVREIRFADEVIFRNRDVRVLFKHLLSLGYIDFLDCADCQKYLNDTIISDPKNFVDISSEQWYWQNPFDASKEEYHLIFDIKDIVDQEFRNHVSGSELAKLIDTDYRHAHSLVASKIGITIKNMMLKKQVSESKKSVAFSGRSIKEIAYDLGYKDTAYFNRVFKRNTGYSPVQFRDQTEYPRPDIFIQDLFEVLSAFHKEQRSVGFYAEKLLMTEKTLSRKVKNKLNTTIGNLIRQEILISSQKMLGDGLPVNNVAHRVGFHETNHFSTFFKRYSGVTPSEFQGKKYQ